MTLTLTSPSDCPERARAEISVAASAARYPVSGLLYRADGRRAGPGNLGQRQDQGLSAVVLGRAAGAAGQGPLSERSRQPISNSSIRRCRRCCWRCPSFFGKIPLYLCLSLLNVVAWWMTAQFSHAMAGSGRKPGPVAGSAAGLSSPSPSCSTCSISASPTWCCWR